MTKLESLIAELEGQVKRANVQKDDVLQGNRADFKGGDAPSKEGPIAKETDNSSFHTPRPADKTYTPSVSEAYVVEDKDKALASKAASLADKILEKLEEEPKKEELTPEQKKEVEETIEEVVKAIKEEGDTPEDTESKKAGAREFFDRLLTEQGEFLHKCAAYFDEDYNTIPQYVQMQKQAEYMQKNASYDKAVQRDAQYGATVAENLMQKIAMDLQSNPEQDAQYGAFVAENIMQKTAADYQDFITGSQYAEQYMQKIAADLVGVNSLLQELYAKNLLSQTEKEALMQALGSQEILTPDVIRAIVMQIVGSEDVANAIISQTEGNTSKNVVPLPSQPISAPALPANTEATLDPNELKVVQASLKILRDKNQRKGL